MPAKRPYTFGEAPAPAGRRGRRAFLAGLGALLLAPAAARGGSFPVQPPPQGLGRFYFYRPEEPLLLTVRPAVIVNGKAVGYLARGALFFRDARPGRYEAFLENDARKVVALRLAEGQIAFLRASLDLGLGTTRLSLALVDPEVALSEILALGNASSAASNPSLQQ